jgi:hypothetical protein
MGKISGSGSGMNNPDHISESLQKFFWVKILKFFNADPGWKKFESGIRDKNPGSATLLLTVLTANESFLMGIVKKSL